MQSPEGRLELSEDMKKLLGISQKLEQETGKPHPVFVTVGEELEIKGGRFKLIHLSDEGSVDPQAHQILMPPRTPYEKEVRAECLNWLNSQPNIYAWPRTVGVFKAGRRTIRVNKVGQSDIEGIIKVRGGRDPQTMMFQKWGDPRRPSGD